MGLTWDASFIRTVPGMCMSAQVMLGLVGGVIGIIFASGFESFLFWTTVIVTGVLLFTHVTNLTQMLETKFPILIKAHLAYLLVWSCLLALDMVLCIISFKLIGVVVGLLLCAFVVDLFLKYRKWKSGDGSGAAAPPPTSPTTLESGGKY